MWVLLSYAVAEVQNMPFAKGKNLKAALGTDYWVQQIIHSQGRAKRMRAQQSYTLRAGYAETLFFIEVIECVGHKKYASSNENEVVGSCGLVRCRYCCRYVVADLARQTVF